MLAEDVVHLFRATRTAQHRGLSWLAPAMLKLAEVNGLQDALQAAVRVSALISVYLVDKNSPGGLPFEGEQSGDTMEVSAEPGATRILRGDWACIRMRRNSRNRAWNS